MTTSITDFAEKRCPAFAMADKTVIKQVSDYNCATAARGPTINQVPDNISETASMFR